MACSRVFRSGGASGGARSWWWGSISAYASPSSARSPDRHECHDPGRGSGWLAPESSDREMQRAGRDRGGGGAFRRTHHRARLALLTAMSVTILVAEADALLQSLLVEILGREEGFEIVGSVGSGPEALDAASRLRPRVLLLDL